MVLGYEKFTIITFNNVGQGRAGSGRGEAGWSKNSKPIPVPFYGVGLKSCPIPAPSPLQGGENPYGTKPERTD